MVLRLWVPLLVVALLPTALDAQEPTAEQAEFFVKKVRPLLARSCFSCHGEMKSKNNLRLDSRTAALEGGDAGPALVPGKPDDSLLIQAVRYGGEIKMPPKGRLTDGEIADLVAWVKQGAHWPDK
jgi:mono/diheme cytochrome c family protein